VSGYIYAIECGERIKIGHSMKPELRFVKIASDAPYPCTLIGYWPGSRVDEKDIHDLFSSIRVHREWFAITIELRLFIEARAQPHQKKTKANGNPGKPRIEEWHDPAMTIVEFLGGIEAVSEIADVRVCSVYRWMWSKSRKGSGGIIPARHAQRLLRYARENNIDLRGGDFFDPTRLQALLAEQSEPEPTEAAA